VKKLIVLAAFFAAFSAHAAAQYGEVITDSTQCAILLRAVACDVNFDNFLAIESNVKACGGYRSNSRATAGIAFLLNDGDLVMTTFKGEGVRIGEGARVGGVRKNVCPATRYWSYLGQTFKFMTFLDENKFFTITREGNVYYALPTQDFYSLRENGAEYSDVNRIFSNGDKIRLEIVSRITGDRFYKDIDSGSLASRRENGIDSQVELRSRKAASNSRIRDSVFFQR
jgi:hypothetical protein